MEMKPLTIDDIARVFSVKREDFSQDCIAIINERDFRRRVLTGKEKDEVILKVLARIDSGRLSVSGPHRQNDWERGWGENFEEYEKTADIAVLAPKFLKPDEPLRMEYEYILPSSPRFEFDVIDVFRRWLFGKYFSGKNAIYEFGCGSCQHFDVLARMFPETKIVGLDWANASLKIINRLVEQQGWNMEGKLFDLFHPDEHIKIAKNSAVFTMGTLEQLGTHFEPFLNYLLANTPAVCVHVETMRELYDEHRLTDYLAIKFDEQRGYLNGFLTRLRELEDKGSVEIMEARRIPFGSTYHDSYSLVVWRPRISR